MADRHGNEQTEKKDQQEGKQSKKKHFLWCTCAKNEKKACKRQKKKI
jgi:hypothetical protein